MSRSKNAIIGLFILLCIGFGAGGVYLAEKLYWGPMREQARLVANLKLIVEQLTKDVRMAEVAVLSQTPERTKFKFVEVNEKGDAIGEPVVIDVEGEEVYFDMLVIKFEEPFKPLNESLKDKELSEQFMNKSIILFRRVFSSKQKPEDGYVLDKPGQTPGGYGSKAASDVEQKLWQEFWELANDPKLAKERGVRAAHGQAVYTKLKKDKYYVLEKRVSGEATIKPVEKPAVLK
ncbi:MAG TPA: hypothetical protein VEK08_19735 [Planctomycetota bacterium]|nr:hypothetical protein [Planctomycetota bacterium]